MLIISPSLVSGVGVGFISSRSSPTTTGSAPSPLPVGVVLLWLDFFITMPIFRRSIRAIDSRIRKLEERLQ